MELILGATLLVPLSAAAAAITIKINYFIEREKRADIMISEYDNAYLDLAEIFVQKRMADLGATKEESTDFLAVLAQVALQPDVPLGPVAESPEIGTEAVSVASTSSQTDESSQSEKSVESSKSKSSDRSGSKSVKSTKSDKSGETDESDKTKASKTEEDESATKRYTIRHRRPKNVIAYALAQEAYYNFGARPRTEANNLITRRWMRDRMDSFGDVRFIDRASIIDKALVLSFLPTLESRETESLAQTYSFLDRSTTTPLYKLFLRLLPSFGESSSRAAC